MILDKIKKIDSKEKILWYLGRNTFLKYLDDEKYLRLAFKAYLKYSLDLNNPQTFNAKLQWLKLNDKNPMYTELVDKYLVKKYVSERIGEEYVIPCLGVWSSPKEIDFDELPNRFVLKCTHDSGGVVICKDKTKMNIHKVRKQLTKSIRRDYFLEGREWPYKNVKRQVIAEEYVESKDGTEMIDYKFMCYNGIVKNLFTCTERFDADGCTGGLKVTFFDTNWNVLPFERKYPKSKKKIPKPSNLEKMIEIAETLSKGIPFVRIDLYDVDGKILFGEYTFYPGGGLEWFEPVEWDYRLGELIDIDTVRDKL